MAAFDGSTTQPGLILGLSGGGVRGFAHLGALRAIREAGLPIAGVAGSSAGAYAAANLGLDLPLEVGPLMSLVTTANSPSLHGQRQLAAAGGQDPGPAVQAASLGGDRRCRTAPRRPAQTLRQRWIEELGPPLAINAADLNTGEVPVLCEGPLVDAVMASSAIPGIFPPVPWGGRLLVDGDVVEKVPVTAAQKLVPSPGGRYGDVQPRTPAQTAQLVRGNVDGP